MTRTEDEPGRVLGNVGLLDLRYATTEAVSNVRRIGNVGTVIVAEGSGVTLPLISMRNVGSSIALSSCVDLKIRNGHQRWGHEFLAQQPEPLYAVVNGHLFLEESVSPEAVQQGLGGLIVNGHVLCPEAVVGTLQSKFLQHNGHLQTYEPGASTVMGRVVLDRAFLDSLDDASTLVVVGRLDVPDVLEHDLLRRKIAELRLVGRLRCHEENLAAIKARLQGGPSQPSIKVIPKGFTLYDHPLVLDDRTLPALGASKIYCTDRVEVAAGISNDLLEESIEQIISEDLIIAPKSFEQTVFDRTGSPENRVVVYDGELWLVEDEMEIVASRLKFLEGQATLIVYGEVTIDPDVDPSALHGKLAKVHNLGEIVCSRDQIGALQSRLGISDGELKDIGRDVTENDLGNIGYLRL